jgi:GTP-binding protein HflX
MGEGRIEPFFFNTEELLQKIMTSLFSAVKVFHIENGQIVSSKMFKSNWETFNYLEKIKPSDKNDGLVVSSAADLPISDIKLFMDGRLLNYYAFISHDEEKIPEKIYLHYRSDGKIYFINQPYFLFSLKDQNGKDSCDRKKAAAVFPSNSSPGEIAENIKLMEDAGYLVICRKTVSALNRNSSIESLASWIEQTDETDTVALFLQVNPGHLSKLETITGREIITRDDLIIEIFESRADGSSGKLKLANAMIEREKTVFRKKIKGLSRIKGGIGLKGPGETKEEERKRILKNKEAAVRKALKSEWKRMELQKKSRMKRDIPSVAIVGYTNAGKSTLFNALLNEKCVTESSAFFSSIDPKIKKMHLFRKDIFLIDTVGFIENMSSDIIDAYKATFSEIIDTSLIIHVVDSTSSGWKNKKQYIESLLAESGADKEKILTLFSKKDLVKVKHPIQNGFFYSAFEKEDIRLIKDTLYRIVFAGL